MRKYLLLSSIVVLIMYYISTFIISFTLLARSVVSNDPIALKKYINATELENNFFIDIYGFTSNLINTMDKKINIQYETFELTGELTSTFLEKLFSQLSKNISTDFSSPETMLYFYFNSNELNKYLNKSFTYLGDYNFQQYLLEKQIENAKDVEKNKNEKEDINIIEKEKEEIKEKNIISKFIKRFKSTDYFFLTSPIHFKINVKHQDISFIIILKFNGYLWKVQKIIIPYKKLINPKNINLSN